MNHADAGYMYENTFTQMVTFCQTLWQGDCWMMHMYEYIVSGSDQVIWINVLRIFLIVKWRE